MKNANVFGVFSVVGAMVLLGLVSTSEAGTSHSLATAPGPHLVPHQPVSGVDSTPSEFGNCVIVSDNGSLRIAATSTCTGSAGTWSAWRRAYVNLMWSPNPGSSETASWYATTPTDTQFAGRAVSYFPDGTIHDVAPYVYGSGWQSSSALSAAGLMFLQANFRTKGGFQVSPILHTVTAEVYAE